MKNRSRCLSGLVIGLFSCSAMAVNITFDGELLDRPCLINSDSLNQTVYFLNRPIKDFYEGAGKSPDAVFSIRLFDCDRTAVGKSVKLKFSGETEPGMKERAKYFLRVSGVNRGRLAIGILDADLHQLKIGDIDNSQKIAIIDSDSVSLNFKAFVQSTPDSVMRKDIEEGEYSAVVNFELFYQ